MLIIQIFLGAIALTMSRQLYWLFVGAVGFVLGFFLTTQFLPPQTEGMLLVYSLGAGVLFMIAAFALQKVAVELAGFVVGGYMAYIMMDYLKWGNPDLAWLAFLIGGLIGFGLMIALFDWTLITLSSIFGAMLIVQPIQSMYGLQTSRLLFVALLVLGISVQTIFWRQEASLPT
jgi:hypothetical protein